ncbi:hypothetical protein VCR26J2_370622 [Vibrio coralliirubri]|nr:hypothetical protein VCR8J2_190564 [Vibrio coralliirubri]CDT78927.1 hypothetical protein VCR26J2_370622 [Vibrio coralliirubri]
MKKRSIVERFLTCLNQLLGRVDLSRLNFVRDKSVLIAAREK